MLVHGAAVLEPAGQLVDRGSGVALFGDGALLSLRGLH